jgi:hypothetical protein
VNKLILSIFLILLPLPAFAYIGPGIGGGIIAVVVGFFFAIFLAIWGILYYPIKRALKSRKDKKIASTKSEDASD